MHRFLVGATAAAVMLAPIAPVEARIAVPAASKYTVCNFDDPSVPKANTEYPFGFLLSTALAGTSKRKVRKAVRSVQEVLRAVEIRDDAGRLVVVDGSYGPRTAQAISRFQKRQGLIVDGKVGQQTWKRLGKKFCWMFH
jgi:murein L,D-transpeptidase YcbB/YkuD